MSFYVPLPRHSAKPYKEFIAAISQEFVVDSPYARLRVNHVASLWAAFIDARQAHADLADKPLTSEHHLQRTRSSRRVANNAGRAYQAALTGLTSTLRRQRASEPPDTGAALIAARGAVGQRPNLRPQSAYQRMEREAQQRASAAGGARG